MGVFQCVVYYFGVVGCVEGIICVVDLVEGGFCYVDDFLYDGVVDFGWVDEMCYVEMFGYGFFVVVQIDVDDFVGFCQMQVLNDVQIDVVQIEDYG